MTLSRHTLRWLSVVLVALVTGWLSLERVDTAPQHTAAAASLTWSKLPTEGQQVGAQIAQGGPFRFEKDGSVFGNRERLLPGHKRGYYREYTVPTPGLNHRGARRIVCGGLQPQAPDVCFYSDDHYSSFRPIQGQLPQRSR